MNPEYEKLFGGNIRRAREARGMTQEQVAAKLQLGGCDITRCSRRTSLSLEEQSLQTRLPENSIVSSDEPQKIQRAAYLRMMI